MDYREKCLVAGVAGLATGAFMIAIAMFSGINVSILRWPFSMLLYAATGYWGARGRGLEYGLLLGLIAGIGNAVGMLMLAVGFTFLFGSATNGWWASALVALLLMPLGGAFGAFVGILPSLGDER
jgi:hypothetical protein